MLGHMQFVLLLLVLIRIEQSTGRVNVAQRKQPTSQPQPKSQSANSMPKDLFSSLRKMTSTKDFLVQMNMYEQEKNKSNLPSQVKPPSKLKSRNLDGVSIANMIDTNIQTCKVRPYIHFVTQPSESEAAFIWPYAVKVPRCIGSCNVRREILECRGTTKLNISVPSYKVSYHSSRKRREVMDEFAKLKGQIHELSKRSAGSSHVTPFTMQVEGDTNCQCECTKTAEACIKEGKVLNKDYCQCQCPNVQQCTLPFEWDEDKCKCVCGSKDKLKNERQCFNSNPKKRWNQEKCDCLCQHQRSCPTQNTFDSNTCECTCNANAKCPSHQILIPLHGTKMCWCFDKN